MSDQVSSTKQIITKVVEDVVERKLQPVNKRLDNLETKFDQMLDLMTDMMGEIKDMREEQQLLSHKVYACPPYLTGLQYG